MLAAWLFVCIKCAAAAAVSMCTLALRFVFELNGWLLGRGILSPLTTFLPLHAIYQADAGGLLCNDWLI